MSAPSARDTILKAIRGSLGVQDGDKAREAAVRKRIERHPANLIPERAQRGKAARIDLLVSMLESQNARVTRVRALKDIPGVVADYLRENNLPARFRTGADRLLNRIPWKNAPALTRDGGRGQADDAVTVSHAAGAAAETGTLYLTSGADNPTTLNFLPDTHIAIVRADDILGPYEDVWNRLRETYGERALPRTVNLISGPSRTADIEQIIVMGAHGPRRLHVIIVE